MSSKDQDVISGLKKILANKYALYLKTQNFHWNVRGPHFKSLHEFFQSQYEDLSESIDHIAERIRAKGEFAPGSFSSFQELSEVSDGVPSIESTEMLEELFRDHKKLVGILSQALNDAKSANDDATADMIIARIIAHEKHSWMLGSHLDS